MKTTTVLQFSELADICQFIKVIHASSYRIDTIKLTVKLLLTEFELAVAVEQFYAQVVQHAETA